MTSAPTRRSLAFMACPPEDLVDLAAELTRACPRARWDLICFYPPPADIAYPGRVIVSRRAFWLAASIWMRALSGRYDRAIVCCRDLSQPSALRSLLMFVSTLPLGEKQLVDRAGMRQGIPHATPRTVLSLAITPLLLLVAQLVTRVGLSLRVEPRRPRPKHRPGRTAILVPILPDLSHTFVYREVLALKRRHPGYLVVGLERGDDSVVHADAAELLRHTEFPPALSPLRYLIWYLSAWTRRPLAMARLVRLFRRESALFGPGARDDDALCFLRLEHLHHSNYVMAGFVLAEFLRRRNVNYVHVYGSTYPSVRALVAHRLLGIPFSISTFVDFDCVTPFHLLREKFQAARFVVTCTEFCARRLADRLPDLKPRFRVLHHALPHGYAASPRLRPVDGRSRLVYVGRFVSKKGIDTLLRACAVLKRHGVDFTCHLYGAGDEQASLERLAGALDLGASVLFEKPIPNERFYEVMNRDDLFVCASRYAADGERDGIPVALVEAMAAGITAVSTRVSGIPELIEHGYNAYLVAPDDPEQLADELADLLRNPERRRAIVEPAIRTIRERFSLERTSEVLAGWISRETSWAVETSRSAGRPVSEPAGSGGVS